MNVVQREHPDATMHRHAATLSEIKKMHEDYAGMQRELFDARALIARQSNQIELLHTDSERWRHEASIYRRKLIRLAAAMDMMGKLAVDADAIMRSAKEFEEADREVAGQPEQPVAAITKAET